MGRVVSAADYAAAALALIIGVHIALSAGKASTMRSYLTIALCASAVTVGLAALATLAVIARSVKVEAVIRLTGNVFAMIGVWCALALVAHAVGTVSVAARRVRLAGVVMIGCVSVMIALLLAAARATDLAPVVCQALYISYMCWGIVGVLWLICRCARHGAHRRTRLALRLYLIAGSTGLAWVGWQIAAVVAVAAGKQSLADQAGISDCLAAVAIALMVCGAGTLSSERWIALAHAWHDYHALGPLWRQVTVAVPEVLLPGSSADAGVEYALYRRVIEIRDAQRILRRYRDPTMPDALAVAMDDRKSAHAELIVEATELAAALAGHRSGRRYQTDAASMWTPQRRPIGDLRAEARWLVQVARALPKRGNQVIDA